MSNSDAVEFPGDVAISDPVAQYTPSNPLQGRDSIVEELTELDYQHDPVTTLHLSIVLNQMPDHMTRFPYLGVPLSKAERFVGSNEVLQDASCCLVIGFELSDDVVKTTDDVPDITEGIAVNDFQEIISGVDASADRLIQDVDVFAFQFTDPRFDYANHTVSYVADPAEYNYFTVFRDEFAEIDGTGGTVFQDTTPAEFTDTVAGLLQFKGELLVDACNDPSLRDAYRNRFLTPLISPFGAARTSTEPASSPDHWL